MVLVSYILGQGSLFNRAQNADLQNRCPKSQHRQQSALDAVQGRGEPDSLEPSGDRRPIDTRADVSRL